MVIYLIALLSFGTWDHSTFLLKKVVINTIFKLLIRHTHGAFSQRPLVLQLI